MHFPEKDSARYKWVMLGLLTFTYFLMHAARQIFNAAFPQIKADLPGTSDAEWGFTRTVFLFSYAMMVPIAGIAADLFKRKWVIVIGALMFSSSVFFTGWVGGFVSMLIMYGLLNGIGQCMIPASCGSLIAQYHVNTRSTALSIYQTGLYFGVIIASAVSGWLGTVSNGGWRMAFWVFGAISLVWVLVLMVFLRDTPPIATADKEDKASFKEAALAMISKPSAILLTFAFGMLVFGSNCFRTFMPLYLVKESGYGLTLGGAAFHGVFWFFLGSFIGIFFGARLSDRLSAIRSGVRFEIMAFGLLVSAPAMAGMVYMPSLLWSCAVMFLFGFGGGFFDCNIYAGLFDVVAPRYRAAATGVYLCGAFFIGCPATAVLGWVGQHFSYQQGIALFGATYLIGALAVIFARVVFYRKDKVE
ncbi:MAG: MFS transporter [Kiritimatiellae bacterium]|nr:MFS transporter [Kiritimatiellia bacterium]